MGRWRRPKAEIYQQQDFQGTRSSSSSYNNKKPPLVNWQPTVPTWEKKFCSSVGCFTWDQFLKAKRFTYIYDNILKWNDSAGEEAFHNAKNRFWAQINGFPCNLPSPDPDIYIDEIDWNSETDTELLLDLEKGPEIPDETKKSKEVVVILDYAILNPAFSYSAGGWGDAPNDGEDNEKFWEKEYVHNEPQAWDRWDCNDGWDNNKVAENNISDQKTAGDWGYHTENNWKTAADWRGYENNGNREGTGSNNMSRYKTTRFYNGDHPVNQGRRGKRVDFATNRWNAVNSCQPVGHY